MVEDDEILTELKTIRTLLSLEKEERLKKITEDSDEFQEAILDELQFDDWTKTSAFKEDLIEQFDSSSSTFNRKIKDLRTKNLIEKKGSGRGTMLKKSALLKAANLVGQI